MKEIARKLTDLYDQMLLRHEKMGKVIAENTIKTQANKEAAADLESRIKALAVLEKKYKDIETADLCRQEVKDIQAQNKADRLQISADRDQVARDKEAMLKEVDDYRVEVKDADDKVKKAEKALDEDKKEYKDKIMSSITVELKKKGIDL